MTYDRLINICTAGSRRDKVLKPQQVRWSDHLTRLSIPVRSAETVSAYHAMKKSQQDELKDVGGYVAGELANGIRKNAAVKGRDIIVLDADYIPAGGTDDALRRCAGLGCGWAVHSTRKHTPAAPRLRFMFPLDRTVTAEEYEPIARKMAEFLDLGWFDPTTFQPARIMYWPSVSSDGVYIYHYEDKPFASADGLLRLYKDWRDMASWPQVPGHKAQHAPAEKQEDPTTKPGVVGAWCRTYNIYQAMEQFLPGVYEPVDNAPDRYTFTGGSTAGGAIVYDNGKYLYSHHATDPAGGRLVNSFDLVRLHLYGALDDDAKEGTPVSRHPSYERMKQMALADKSVSALVNQERGQQLLDDFGTPSQPSGELSEFLGSLDGKPLTSALLRELLKHLGITLRENMIRGELELKGYPSEWSSERAVENLPVYLIDLLKPAGVKGAFKANVCDCLGVFADENRFNPVADMLSGVQWDGADRFAELFGIVGIAQPFDQLLFRKWLIQCIAMALNDPDNPQGADGVLVLQGPQGIGKTSTFRCICPDPQLFKEGADLDPRNKDTVIQATSSWICELGELERTTKRDHAALKALLTAARDHYRAPYARTAAKRARRTSFCGTVNPDEYLIDDTGNRRFWTVQVSKIDLSALFSLTREWKIQLWAQAHHLYKSHPQSFRLTGEERLRLEARNQEFTKPLDYELEVKALLDYTMPVSEWGHYRTCDIGARINPRPPLNRLGRALAKLAREDPRIEAKKSENGTLYRLPLRCPFDPCAPSTWNVEQDARNP